MNHDFDFMIKCTKMLKKPTVTSFCMGRGVNIFLAILLLMIINGYLVYKDLVIRTSHVLLPPPPLNHDLEHFMRSRKLQSYIDDEEEPLIEPSSPCQDTEHMPLVILVTSAPHRTAQRDAIRNTWGKYQPTYFFLGLPADEINEKLVDYYVEAKQYGDIIVGNFADSYQNLTLKGGLMFRWAHRRCRGAGFYMKTDDDVLVNPWTIQQVLVDNASSELIGYMKNNSSPHRDAYNKWYLPRWLYPQDVIPYYLSGTAYLIHGAHLTKIYKEAFKVPMINLEDVYFTYLVANQSLGYRLKHDQRLSPYQPIVPLECAYWSLATLHSLTPENMFKVWPKIRALGEKFEDDKKVCEFYNDYVNNEVLLY